MSGINCQLIVFRKSRIHLEKYTWTLDKLSCLLPSGLLLGWQSC